MLVTFVVIVNWFFHILWLINLAINLLITKLSLYLGFYFPNIIYLFCQFILYCFGLFKPKNNKYLGEGVDVCDV